VHRAFTVAISREAGTQGTAIAREVGNRLVWQVYDHELLERIAQDSGLRANLLETVDERRQSWITETFETLLSAPGKSEWDPLVGECAYVHHLVKTLLALGTEGECVIVGRGAVFVLPLDRTLRVRLMAPVQERITALSRKLGITDSEAAQRVQTLDRARTDFVQDHFRKDPRDPHNYDLVLNTLRLSVAQNAELVVEALRRLVAQELEKNTVRMSN
jgi:cytidylate kinase